MANTYTSLQYHVVFSIKNREPCLTEPICERLRPYLCGITRENNMKALAIGGVADHILLLFVLLPTLVISKALQQLKGASSRWIHENFPALPHFGWQDGYGAFTVSESQMPTDRDYIRHQPEHHRVPTFAEEYQTFLERHGIEFDERYLLG